MCYCHHLFSNIYHNSDRSRGGKGSELGRCGFSHIVGKRSSHRQEQICDDNSRNLMAAILVKQDIDLADLVSEFVSLCCIVARTVLALFSVQNEQQSWQ